MKAMDDTPERLAIIRRMVDILVEDAPIIPDFHRIEYALYHQWYRGFKPHGMTGGYLKYRDVDVGLRERLRREWNRPNYRALLYVLGPLAALMFVLALLKRQVPPGGVYA
jgi:hypothetical protein